MSEDFSLFGHSRHDGHGDRKYISHEKYHDDDHHGYGYRDDRRSGHHDDLMNYFESCARSILHNKLLMILLALALVLVLVIAIVLIVLFYPFLVKLWGFLLDNGLKGIIDLVQPILNLIWQGQGK